MQWNTGEGDWDMETCRDSRVIYFQHRYGISIRRMKNEGGRCYYLFISDHKVGVILEQISGTLDVRQKYTLDGAPVHHRASCTHIYTLIYT